MDRRVHRSAQGAETKNFAELHMKTCRPRVAGDAAVTGGALEGGEDEDRNICEGTGPEL